MMIHEAIRIFTMTLLVTVCLLLAHFFSRRWSDPVFRAFTIYFAISGLIYLGLIVMDSLFSWTSPVFVQWRTTVYLTLKTLTLLNLAWALRPKDGRGS